MIIFEVFYYVQITNDKYGRLWTNLFRVELGRLKEGKIEPRGFKDGKKIRDMADVCGWRDATDEGSATLHDFLTLATPADQHSLVEPPRTRGDLLLFSFT